MYIYLYIFVYMKVEGEQLREKGMKTDGKKRRSWEGGQRQNAYVFFSYENVY